MPVYLYTGSPGSGKTYYVVKNVILQTIKEKRMVITNVKLNLEVLTHEEQNYYLYVNPLDKDFIKQYRTKCWNALHPNTDVIYSPPDGIPFFSLPLDYKYPYVNDQGQAPLFVIDECQKVLSKSAKPSKELIHFYQEHRHFSEMDIVLVTQGQKYLDETLKELVEETFYLQKARFKGKDKYHVRKYSGLRDRSTQPQLNRTESYKQYVFKYYKSQTQSKKEVQREEVNKSSKFIIYLKYFFILMIFGGLYVAWSTWESFKKPNNVPVTSDQQTFSSSNRQLNDSNEFVGPPRNTQKSETVDYRNLNARPSLPKREVVQNSGTVEHSPYFNYRISITAYIASKKDYLMSFKIYHDERAVSFTQTHKQMVQLGYSVTVLNDCLALIDHPREQNPFYVHCELQDRQDRMADRKI